MILVFTLCSNNYLAQACTLGKSLLEYNPDYNFKIGLVDRKTEEINYTKIPFEIIEVESIGINAFDDMFKRYNITELNTAVKPFYFKHFFETFNTGDKCIFLDPDIFVYKSFYELEKVLEVDEIVITPHFTTPIKDNKFQAESDFLNSGLYNLGFIAMKKGKESQKLIEWWAQRLETKAHLDFARGMFTDQLWINFAPLFFKNVNLFYHPGYNMAYWNMHERILDENGMVVKNNICYPLVFFHFSGFNPNSPEILSKYQDRYSFENRKDIYLLFKDYSSKLFVNEYAKFIQIPCHYLIEKRKSDLDAYKKYKKSIPIYKRIIRGITLRFLRFFNVNVDYYIN